MIVGTLRLTHIIFYAKTTISFVQKWPQKKKKLKDLEEEKYLLNNEERVCCKRYNGCLELIIFDWPLLYMVMVCRLPNQKCTFLSLCISQFILEQCG